MWGGVLQNQRHAVASKRDRQGSESRKMQALWWFFHRRLTAGILGIAGGLIIVGHAPLPTACAIIPGTGAVVTGNLRHCRGAMNPAIIALSAGGASHDRYGGRHPSAYRNA